MKSYLVRFYPKTGIYASEVTATSKASAIAKARAEFGSMLNGRKYSVSVSEI